MVHPERSAVLEYHHTIFSICMVFLTTGFTRETAEERFDLKSLKGWTKAEELGAWRPELLSLRPSLKYAL